MPKKRVTKIDPRKELSPYLNHQENQNRNHKKKSKVSASLSKLKSYRRKSLFKNLGIIVGTSLIAVLILGYYVSPLANVNNVQVVGADDLSSKKVVSSSGIKASDKLIDYRLNSKKLNSNLEKKYPEIQHVNVEISHINRLVLNVKEYPTIAYIKVKDGYRKLLSNGKIGSNALAWSKIDQGKPLFIGYSKKTSLIDDLELFNSLPASFRNQVKLLSGSAIRKSQIILVMKDGNVVIGDISTFKQKIKYYNAIKKKAGKNSLIDLEVGAFSRPLTKSEMKAYGIS